MVDVILVEEDLTESALACIAIGLRRPGTKVAEVRTVKEAKRILEAQTRALVILGPTALRNRLDSFINEAPSAITVVGLANGWKAYVGAVEGMLRDWLPGADRCR